MISVQSSALDLNQDDIAVVNIDATRQINGEFLGRSSYIYVGNESFETVSSPSFQTNFKKNANETVIINSIGKSYWQRITFYNHYSTQQPIILCSDHDIASEINVYQQTLMSTWTHEHILKQRITSLSLKPMSYTTIYINRISYGPMIQSYSFWQDTDELMTYIIKSSNEFSIILAIFGMSWLFSIVLSIGYRSKIYLYYSLYVACYMMIATLSWGILEIPHSDVWAYFCGIISWIAIALFSNFFLHFNPPMRKILFGFMAILLIALLLLPFQTMVATKIMDIFIGIPLPLFLLICAGYIYKKKRQLHVAIFILAFGAFHLGISLQVLAVYDLVPYYSNKLHYLASIIENILMLAAICNRIFNTEKDRLQNSLNVNREKTEFFHNISHELRTPLTLILNPLELESRENPGNNNIKIAAKNSRRLLRLINQLLDLHQIDSAQKNLDLTPINLVHIIKTCKEYFAPACHVKGIDFKIQSNHHGSISESTLVKILGDVDAVEKIIFVYLSNALKFTKRNGRIELGLTVTTNKVRMYVSDHGPGLSEHDQKKLFQIFGQPTTIGPKNYLGNGLGLALAKSLAEKMHGQFGVTSELGQGSTFWVDFPLIGSESTLINILIIEDDYDYGALLVETLSEELGLEDNTIHVRKNINDAISFLKENSVSCIISDYRLDEENGLDLMKKISHLYPSVYRILMTAETESNFLEQAINENLVHAFFNKTFDSEILTKKIAAVITTNVSDYEIIPKEDNREIDILIVDENESHRHNLEDIFLAYSKNDQFRAAASTKEAIEILEKNRVRCLVADENILLATRLSFFEEVEKRFPDTLLCMLSHKNIKINQTALKKTDVDQVFEKPINTQKVTDTMQKLMNDHNFKITQMFLDEIKTSNIDDECEPTKKQMFVQSTQILVIDDQYDMSEMIKEQLGPRGYGIVSLNQSEEGIDRIKSLQPDLIILDWLMPQVSVMNLIQQIKEDTDLKTIPVVLLTSKDDDRNKRSAIAVGADAFLSKPFNVDELIPIVQNLLQLKSKEKRLENALNHLQEINKEDMRQAQDIILKQERGLRDLLQELTHDLKTPLASIYSLTQNLKNQRSGSFKENSQQLDVLNREVVYFQKLLEDLLFLSGLVSSGSTTTEKEFNLSNIILDIAEVVEEKSGRDIELNCLDDLSYCADPFLFRRMIRNLLDNAIKYSRQKIMVTVYVKNKLLFIEIKDDGPGLSEEKIETYGRKQRSRFMNNIHSIENTDNNMPPYCEVSLGLGSVIVSNIVKKFGGQLTIQNAPKAGALITISLPVKEEENQRKAS